MKSSSKLRITFPIMATGALALAATLALAQVSGIPLSPDAEKDKTEKVAVAETENNQNKTEDTEISVAKEQSQRIELDNVTAKELIDELKKRGFNFIIDTTDIPKDKKFSIHMDGATDKQILTAVARAFDLGVMDNDGVITFKKMAFKLHGEDGLMFKWHDGEHNFKGLEDGNFMFDPGEMGEHIFKFFEGDGEGTHKFFYQHDGEVFGMSEEEFKKHMEELHENLKDLKFEVHKEFMNNEDIKKLKEELKDMKIEIDREGIKDLKAKIKLKSENIDKLITSLTKEQREKMDKNGHLTLDDLTKEQKSLLGDIADDAVFNIEVKTENGVIKIKNKK